MKELVIKAKSHDRDAFAELIKLNESSMYKAAFAILSNDDDVADAMQDAILLCWQKIGSLKEDCFFKTWLIRILINCCYDIRSAKKFMVSQENVVETGSEDSGIMQFEWKELLSHLEEKHRVVIELYYVDGFKVREIAEILGLKETTVKDRLAAARKNVSKLLEKDEVRYGTI